MTMWYTTPLTECQHQHSFILRLLKCVRSKMLDIIEFVLVKVTFFSDSNWDSCAQIAFNDRENSSKEVSVKWHEIAYDNRCLALVNRLFRSPPEKCVGRSICEYRICVHCTSTPTNRLASGGNYEVILYTRHIWNVQPTQLNKIEMK